MEIREFACRVLFAGTLEEKLAPGEVLTDHEPGEAILAPGAPGRPRDLRIRKDGARAEFPGDARLMDEEQRGILLHFFANHELLATELMALVLLKFPDAPRAFRRGIVQTLREEQQHTLWYLQRMKECGVRFGDFGLNGFFWDAIAPMETPLDYVTRLSLTFEQANLDYSRHYAQVMSEAGDSETARILDRIYRDEIGHVGYGLRWFRKWKEPKSSDWEAYQGQLAFPLSPSRGKGNVAFNVEGRRRAGLADSFIREMEIFSRSRGRTPNVFCFDPDAEAAMAQGLDGRGFEARVGVKALGRDLEILAAFLARRDDVVLVREIPSRDHLYRLQSLGFALPEFEALAPDGTLSSESLLRERKINCLRPWAWCPRSARRLSPLMENLPEPEGIERFWNEKVRSLFSKRFDLEQSDGVLQSEGIGEGAADPAAAGIFCETAGQFSDAIGVLAGRGANWLVGKALFGAAGQKNLRFSVSDFEKARAWAARIIDRQGGVIVEPWLDRVMDFSIHYEVGQRSLRRLGFVQLINDRRGQFRAGVSTVKCLHNIDSDVAAFLMGSRGRPGALSAYDDVIPSVLLPAFQEAGYSGPVGIDALVYRDREDGLRLKPIVEINPRHTMGRLTWELMKQVEPGHSVRFEIFNRASLARSGFDDFESCADYLRKVAPSSIGSSGRLSGGSVVLNEAGNARQAIALLTVAKQSAQLKSAPGAAAMVE